MPEVGAIEKLWFKVLGAILDCGIKVGSMIKSKLRKKV
jgi:hypothetical protein